MPTVSQVLHQVRRAMAVGFAKFTAYVGVLAVLMYWLTDMDVIFYMAPVILIVAALQVYAGRYIPISSKHDSLFNKYGDAYRQEVTKAVKQHGMDKLISTHWFEVYADEFCRRRGDS